MLYTNRVSPEFEATNLPVSFGLIFGPDVGHWTAARIAGQYFEAGSQAIGLERGGKIIAGVIYEHFNGKSIVCHMAAAGRLTRHFIWTIFDYAYVQCGVEKVILPIASSNLNSVKLVLNMGFKEEARIIDAHPTGDVVFFTLKRTDCRFVGGPNWARVRRVHRPPQITPEPQPLRAPQT